MGLPAAYSTTLPEILRILSLLRPKVNNSCAPASRFRWRVGKPEHVWTLAEQSPNNSPLRACSAAMNDPHLRQTSVAALIQILFNSRPDVLRRKWMQVQTILDWDYYRFIAFRDIGVISHFQPPKLLRHFTYGRTGLPAEQCRFRQSDRRKSPANG